MGEFLRRRKLRRDYADGTVFPRSSFVPRAMFSKHCRHRQPEYRERSCALVSSLNLISEHQQPVSAAPQVNPLPHASQLDDLRQRSERNSATVFKVTPSARLVHFVSVLFFRSLQAQTINPSLVSFQYLNVETTKSETRAGGRHLA